MKTESTQMQDLTTVDEYSKRKSIEFKLFAGFYSPSLDAINPQIKGILVDKYNEVDKLKKEITTLQQENQALIN
jgi:hypothetical protein